MEHLHAIEERDFGRGPLLWDAAPDVCCAAYQLGACRHTEADSYLYELDELDDAELDVDDQADELDHADELVPEPF